MKREAIILIAAILMGVAAAIFYNLHISSLEAEMRAQLKDKVAVCAVEQRLGARQRLTEQLIVRRQIPRAFVHPDAVRWDSRTEIRGQVVLHPMEAEQVVLWSDLQEKSRRSVDDSIPPGRGVVTIPIDMVGGVSGLISPGSRVDLVGIFRRLSFRDDEDETRQQVRQQVQDLEDLNAMLSQMDALTQNLAGEKPAEFYVVPIASNLGVFAVGTETQSGNAAGGEAREGYSTISFDVPQKTQILLIMAMHKVESQGGRLVCVLRSSQVATDELDKPGEVHRAGEFLKLIPKAYAELQDSR